MFVDDIIIYYIGKEVEEIIDVLNYILNDFRVWCCNNYLIVYIGKIVVMLIFNYFFVGLLRFVMFGNFYIYFIIKFICLGVEIDYKLNWKFYVKVLYIKFGGKLKFLKNFKVFFLSVLEEIYFKGIVLSIIYCIVIWGFCLLFIFYILEYLYLKVVKLVYKFFIEIFDIDVFDFVKWKFLVYIYKCRVVFIMYQIYYNSLFD